ncbi:glycosyl transferase family protein [Planococcus antarcticus DSM 14505]|uniref:Glycosyl transferase family protein n=1 Tax=Planococcus antarcticus DSM 14505 TaxID=1185653 RepID=A0AA87LTV5_9BACL|nr:glycosyltransferase family A protein [Planococcus antarcticus]EIM05715.1 glycosyl transferase family protein [Planococcus antarcticus DSM 14505]
MKDKKITVFTPTYNRAYILSQGYESLKKQTNKSFLWLIVDDGSTDNTEELVHSWRSEEIIEILYYKQLNGGKQRAHNKAIEMCKTDLFVCVDSDDFLTENAVETFISTWDSIEDKSGISGLVALRGIDRNTPIGTNMPNGIQLSTLTDLYNRHKFRGDTVLLYKTEVLKEFPFFVAEGEKFMGEGYIYTQIDQKYCLFLLNQIVYIGEYLQDGYTANVKKIIKENPKSYTMLKKQEVIYAKTTKIKYLNSIKYMVGCMLSKEKSPIKKAPEKLLAILAYPPALAYYIIYFR